MLWITNKFICVFGGRSSQFGEAMNFAESSKPMVSKRMLKSAEIE